MEPIKNQIVVYQPNETVRLDVRLENETVWLTQEQIAIDAYLGIAKGECCQQPIPISNEGGGMMEQLETGNIGIGHTSTLATLNDDRFIIVDQKEIFWKMRRRNAHAFHRGDSAKAESEGRTSVRGASLKDAGRLTFAAAKMYPPSEASCEAGSMRGCAEIIPGLLDSICKATSESVVYPTGKGVAAKKKGGDK